MLDGCRCDALQALVGLELDGDFRSVSDDNLDAVACIQELPESGPPVIPVAP